MVYSSRKEKYVVTFKEGDKIRFTFFISYIIHNNIHNTHPGSIDLVLSETLLRNWTNFEKLDDSVVYRHSKEQFIFNT